MPRIVGYGAFTAVVLAAYEFTGGALKGYFQREDVDGYERKEMLRNRRRIPIEETLAEIGEGRGESPPTSSTPSRPLLWPWLTRFQVSGRQDMRNGGERGSRRSTASTSIPFAPTRTPHRSSEPGLSAGCVYTTQDTLA